MQNRLYHIGTRRKISRSTLADAYQKRDWRIHADFDRLYNLNFSSAYIVTIPKENLQFRRVYSHQVDKSLGLICDQSIALTGLYPS